MNATVEAVLEDLARRAVAVDVNGGKLRLRGPRDATITPEALRILRENEPQIVAVLLSETGDPEVAWRVRVMKAQVPLVGPIPFLAARPWLRPGAKCCLSCGDPLPEGRLYRCGPCAQAAEQALNEAREGLAP